MYAEKSGQGYKNVCGLSWNGSGGTWWADRGIFISHEAVGEIIANSDLQDFGLEAVVNWFIFCYFSTGRKYPAVVYGSYISGLGYIYLWAGAVVFSFSLRGLAKIAQNGF